MWGALAWGHRCRDAGAMHGMQRGGAQRGKCGNTIVQQACEAGGKLAEAAANRAMHEREATGCRVSRRGRAYS